jgi:hypothetical protein
MYIVGLSGWVRLIFAAPLLLAGVCVCAIVWAAAFYARTAWELYNMARDIAVEEWE